MNGAVSELNTYARQRLFLQNERINIRDLSKKYL